MQVSTSHLAIGLAVIGALALVAAIVNERRMQKHRQPGVSYRDVTLRKDGGWRRSDLFTGRGLQFQRRASGFGCLGILLLLAALAVLFV